MMLILDLDFDSNANASAWAWELHKGSLSDALIAKIHRWPVSKHSHLVFGFKDHFQIHHLTLFKTQVTLGYCCCTSNGNNKHFILENIMIFHVGFHMPLWFENAQSQNEVLQTVLIIFKSPSSTKLDTTNLIYHQHGPRSTSSMGLELLVSRIEKWEMIDLIN